MVNRLKSKFKIYFSKEVKAILIVLFVLAVVTIGICSTRKTVTISVNGNEMKVTTFRKTFRKVLSDNGVTIGAKDKVTPNIDSKVKRTDNISIKRAIKIVVDDGGVKTNIMTTKDSVDQLLSSEGYLLAASDKVSPSMGSVLKPGMEIQITRIDSKVIKENLPVDYQTTVQQDDNMEKSTTRVVQDGVQGEKQISTQVIFQNGKEIARQIISEVITKQPIVKIVAEGTLGAITTSRGGDKVLYTKAISVKATSYSNDAITSTGLKTVRNIDGYSTIAVDPTVIPYGTRLYIPGYGFGIATDCGSAIKGNRIDVYLNTEDDAKDWGVQWMDIYILK
ncbi:MAG: 3D domain-containing protein [Bacillota bacterium]|nr:3D domain-containing protein [Bacillota bacterium]